MPQSNIISLALLFSNSGKLHLGLRRRKLLRVLSIQSIRTWDFLVSAISFLTKAMDVSWPDRKKQGTTENIWDNISNIPILTLSLSFIYTKCAWVSLSISSLSQILPTERINNDVCLSNQKPDFHPVCTGRATLMVLILRLFHICW